eukprot:3938691-Rhodomonas_salina.1
MDVLTQSLKTQGETAVTLQREQHAFLERMAERANDTQIRMMAMLSGSVQPQIADKVGSLEGAAMDGESGGRGIESGLDNSFESRFEDMDERDAPLPPLIDVNFLIKELWDPQMRADFAFGRFDGSRMTECQQEINTVLRRKGVPILFPFPVPEKSRLPGEWIPFDLFKAHPAVADESWITNRCSSPVWYHGLQGWYILTGLIKSRKVTVTFNHKWLCYEMSATEQAKRVCTGRPEEALSQSSSSQSSAGPGNGMVPGQFRVNTNL